MRKILFIGAMLISMASSGQLRKDQLNAINTRDIKSFGSYSSLKMGKLIDSLILSLNSQLRAPGYIPVGNASGLSVDVPASGDLTLSSAGAFNIKSGVVTNSMLAGNIDLTSKVTNILPPLNGGTGNGGAPANGDIPIGGGGVFGFLAVGSNGKVLTVNGGLPSWQSPSGGGGTTTNALTVDNSSLQFNTGTTFDGSAARTISVKASGITNSMLAGSISDGNISSASTWNAKQDKLTPPSVKTSNYTAAAGDLVKCDITSSFTVTLPTAPTDKSEILVKIIAPDPVTATSLTVAAGGSDVFNIASGITSFQLTKKNQSVWLQYQSSGAIWIVKTTDNPTVLPPNTQTSDYTLVLADAGKTVYMNKSSNGNLTVPDNSSVAFPLGTKIQVENLTTNTLTFLQGGSATVTGSNGSLLDAGQNIMMELTKIGTNTWDLQNGVANPNLGQIKTLAGDVTTTSATLVNITGLSWSVTANTSYRISGVLHIACNNTGGIKIGNSGPSGFTAYGNTWGHTTGPTAGTFGAFTEASVTAAYMTVNNSGRMFIDGTVTISSTGGTYQLQFESTTAGQTSTVFALGTDVKLEKIQ